MANKIEPRKPNTTKAMQILIKEIRETLPFHLTPNELCKESNNCRGCSLKLLEFLNMECLNWEQKLATGEIPTIRDINSLAKIARKVHTVVSKNNHMF